MQEFQKARTESKDKDLGFVSLAFKQRTRLLNDLTLALYGRSQFYLELFLGGKGYLHVYLAFYWEFSRQDEIIKTLDQSNTPPPPPDCTSFTKVLSVVSVYQRSQLPS